VLSTIDISDFRQKLIRAFPPEPFCGQVSVHDECDEGIALQEELPGKSWAEIPAAFWDSNSGSLPLLERRALVAFLPAWLLRSMETISGEDDSVLAEFTMYFLCPGNEDEGWDEKAIAGLVDLFDSTQRSLVGDFLRMIVKNVALPYWHPYADYGLKWWSGGETSGEPEPK
jgi:hypothetical protein